MTLQEAYDLTMQKLNALKEAGLVVEITPSNPHASSISKYGNRPDRLPVSQWQHVGIQMPDEKSCNLARKAEADLRELGISFDTGYYLLPPTCRDWELDWSFSIEGAQKCGEGLN